MKNLLTFIAILICTSNLLSQNFPIGQFSLFMEDPDRDDRLVTAEMFYPAEVAGPNQMLADGSFPMIVFAHGFLIPFESYENVTEHFVDAGYIVMFITTEGGFTPDHDAFAQDIVYMTDYIVDQATNPQSFLNGHFIPKVALMGHSMGGGSSVLAADQSMYIETYIGLAPAETDPSAIANAQSVNIPSLILSGSADGVTPPEEHHIPIYEGLASDCKVFVDIIGGAHCYFANADFACDLGETAASMGITISREDQQEIFYNYTTSWLDHHLKEIPGALNDYIFPEGEDARVNLINDCMFASSVDSTNENEIEVYPNPVRDVIYLKNNSEHQKYNLFDNHGKLIKKGMVLEKIEFGYLNVGVYFLQLESGIILKVFIAG